METNRQRIALVNLLVALVIAFAAFALARYSHSLAGHVSTAFLSLGVIVCIVSWFQMRLEEQERLEKLEFDELSRQPAKSTLFEGGDGEVFTARRSREQFEKWFVPAITILMFLLQAGGAAWLWRWLDSASPQVAVRQPFVVVSFLAIFALVLLVLGKYSAGIARIAEDRLLRPQASYLLLGFYVTVLVIAGIVVMEIWGVRADAYVAHALCFVLALLAVETLVGLVLEIYRPRVKGKIGPPLYESRLAALLTRPERLLTTLSQALDYQFGFKVSETWFFRFLARAFVWLVLAQVALILLSTCFVFIGTGEEGLLERNGKFRRVLGAGAHLKLPWPIEHVYRFPTDQVQRFNIGFVHDEKDEDEHATGETVLWTVSHYKEEFQLLVASRVPEQATNMVAGKRIPPVNLLSVSIPVQFQITNLMQWAYNHGNASNLLEKIGTREVVRYLVNADIHELMSSGRSQAAEALRKRIQSEADRLSLGVSILFVGLQDVHPPVKVARAYEAVIAAQHKRKANVLAQEAHRVQTNALAAAEAFARVNDARAENLRLQAHASSRAALFTNQVAAFRAAPSAYALRSYLRSLEDGASGARKYVLASTNTDDVILLNLEDKFYDSDITRLTIPQSKTQQ